MVEIKRFMFIKTEADANANKYWKIILYDNDTHETQWGRVGATKGQRKCFKGGEAAVIKKIASKKKRGYKPARVATSDIASSPVISSSLKQVAKSQISHSCPVVATLIDFLVKQNAHQITTQSGGKLNVDIDSGQIQLPSGLGVLTKDAIDEARVLLGTISRYKKRDIRFKHHVQNYLMLVPQVVPSKKGWIKTIFRTKDEINSQLDLLDSLEATLGAIGATEVVTQKIFDVVLTSLTEERKIYNEINKLAGRYTPKSIYGIEIKQMSKAFETGKKCGNIKHLWHGTKSSNLLSILKSGLVIPKSNARHVCGRNFGDGIYFSDQPNKAMSYARTYGGSSFMFLADVAMGKEYITRSWGGRYPKSGYDSTFAKMSAHELIVYRLNQCNLKYLVEFGT